MRLLVPLLLLLAARTEAAGITGLTVDVAPPRVTVALDGAVEGVRVIALDAPPRLMVDLAGVEATWRRTAGAGPILGARVGRFDATTARLVIDLDRRMILRGAAIDPARRLVLTLGPIDAAGFAREVGRGRHPVPTLATRTSVAIDFDLPDDVMPGSDDALLPQPPRRGAKRPLVVLDPGHGGKDSGTISVDGAYEKSVVLAIARAAAAELRRGGLVRVAMTRDRDVFIPLPQRVAIARREKADLFVSIHADSAPNPDARGASVYTLSETASDVVAARLAARENKADIIAGVDLGIDAPEVSDIMIDLVQRSTMNVAANFAETLQASLQPAIGFRGEFHHFAGFRVLKAADIPSVLLETGYLSNPDDTRVLLSDDGQRRIARGIARAIEAHFAGVTRAVSAPISAGRIEETTR